MMLFLKGYNLDILPHPIPIIFINNLKIQNKFNNRKLSIILANTINQQPYSDWYDTAQKGYPEY